MWPATYTGIQIIHEQKIAEALEHSHVSTVPKTQKPALFRIVGTFLTHLSTFSVQKPEIAAPCCDCQG